MSFLAPLFLVGLLAVAIPIAIHLIRRDKPPVVPFSTLRFFQQTSRKQFLFQRFQQWLLMALRALAVALLVLAFARPFFSQTFSGLADMAPRSVAIALDTSMSMGYGDYFDKAKAAAQDKLNDLQAGDEAALILFADDVVEVHGPTTDLESLRDVIDRQQAVGYQTTRYYPALRLADEMLADARFEDRTVHLISDFQATGMTDMPENWKLQPGTNFVSDKVAGTESRNLAITGVKAPATIRTGEAERQVFARVRTLGSVAQQRARLSLVVDDQTSIDQDVDLSEQSEAVVPFTANFSGEGSHTGELTVRDQEFAPDNTYYFTVDWLPRIPVLTVNGEADRDWVHDESHWFRLAVSGDEGSPFAASVILPNELSSAQLRQHQVVALLNVAQLASGQAEALEDFVKAGGSVLIATGDRLQPATFNRQLAALTPATLVAPHYFAGNDYQLIAEVEQRHPVLRPLEVDWTARFDGHWQVKPVEGAEVLMRFDNGRPALVERKLGDGQVMLFTSSLDTEWNNLPLQGMYLPFIHEMLKYLAATPDKQAAYTVGDSVSLPRGTNARITDPSGNPVELAAESQRLTLDQPGIYRVHGEGESAAAQSRYYAVNPPVEESNLRTIAPGDILDRILNPETTPTQSAAVRSQLLKEELEKPQRIWWWILLVVVCLLLAETLLANRTYR